MKRWHWVILLAAIFAFGLWIALPDDPFLDGTIPVPPRTKDSIVLGQLEAIAPVIGKKVIFPSGLVDYLSKGKLINWNGLSFASISDVLASEGHKLTIRDYLNQCRDVAGLNWKYDAAQDAVIFDFAWNQPVSRNARELVDQLVNETPSPLKNLTPNPVWTLVNWRVALNLIPGREGSPYPLLLDSWRVALNELMSEPENYYHVWKVRLEDGCCSMNSLGSSPFFGDDKMSAHILKDADGTKHLFVLNYHEPLASPGPGAIIAYYLFSADGKWEDGGIFEAGDPFCAPTVRFDPGLVIIQIVFQPIKLTNSTTGQVTTLTSSYHAGDTWDYYLQIVGGKLAAVAFGKNGNPANLDMGVTPLRHLGD